MDRTRKRKYNRFWWHIINIWRRKGEYKNGKKCKGIEYESRTVISIVLYEDYITKFKGEYYNGKRWNGFGYDSKGNYLYTLKSGNGKVEAKFKLIQDGCNFIYKGEFINGESICKHSIYGYLRPYNQQIKLFEGEYLNGKIKNGKWYDENGIIECEIKNGNGKGKEYFKNKSLIKGPYDDNEYQRLHILFEGEYLNGERNGKGKEYYSPEEEYDYKKGVKFKGEYLNGKRNGKGKEFYENGALKFEGEYFNGERWNGYELCYFDKYTNNYNHQTDNYNIEYYEIGDVTIEFEEIQDNIIEFEIEYLNGKKWNVISYNEYGDYRFDLINGKGKITEKEYIVNDIDYKIYEGEFLNGKKNGRGTEYYSQICYPHCSCHIECGPYNLVFTGEYLNGKKYKGIECTYDDSVFYFEYIPPDIISIFEGEYLNGKKYNGIVKEKDENGNYFITGEFIDGVFYKQYNDYDYEEEEEEYNMNKYLEKRKRFKRNGKNK